MRLSPAWTYAILPLVAVATIAGGALVAGNVASDRMTAAADKPSPMKAGVGEEIKVAQTDQSYKRANELHFEQLQLERKKHANERAEFQKKLGEATNLAKDLNKRIEELERQRNDLVAQGKVLHSENLKLQIDLAAAKESARAKGHPQPKVAQAIHRCERDDDVNWWKKKYQRTQFWLVCAEAKLRELGYKRAK